MRARTSAQRPIAPEPSRIRAPERDRNRRRRATRSSGSAPTTYVHNRTAGSSSSEDQCSDERPPPSNAGRNARRTIAQVKRVPRPDTGVHESAPPSPDAVPRIPHVLAARLATRDHQLAPRRAGEEGRGQRLVDVGQREVVTFDRHGPITDPSSARACSPCARCNRRRPRPRSREPRRRRSPELFHALDDVRDTEDVGV